MFRRVNQRKNQLFSRIYRFLSYSYCMQPHVVATSVTIKGDNPVFRILNECRTGLFPVISPTSFMGSSTIAVVSSFTQSGCIPNICFKYKLRISRFLIGSPTTSTRKLRSNKKHETARLPEIGSNDPIRFSGPNKPASRNFHFSKYFVHTLDVCYG